MKDTDRKYAKCNRSTAQDPDLKLYRFPMPGRYNIERCRQWAHYCYPDQDWQSLDFQNGLFRSHKMLCHLHFKETDFIDFVLKKLNRYAAPSDSNTLCSASPSTSMDMTQVVTVPAQTSIVIPAQGSSMTSTPASTKTLHSATPSTSMDMTRVVTVAAQTSIPAQGSYMSSTQASTKTAKEKRLYNKCRRNLTTICKLRKELRNLKKDAMLETLCSNDAVQQLSENLTSPFAVLLQGQILNMKRKPKGRRWNLNQKLLALQLYKRSPSCYRLLRRLFSLPSQSTLKNLLNQIPLKPGINTQVFNTIRNTAKKESPEKNECVLMFDEMAIRKHLQYDKKNDLIMGYQDHGSQGRGAQIASYALVFMVAGLRKKLKQPVAYYLSGASVTADRLTVLIKEVLEQCFMAGLNVAATVCDMATTNTKALSNLGATKDHPYFKYGQLEIVALYHTPHLLKCFRNLFLKYNIKCNLGAICQGEGSSNTTNQGVAKWEYIKQFYDIDSLNPNFVFAPSLTADHLNPNSKQKMKVKLATQVLSFTVSAGMYSRIAQGELPAEALTTVNLIKRMDCLFDSLNADSPDLRRGKEFSTNLKDSSKHMNFWNSEMIPLFENMVFIGARNRPPLQDGWIHTLKGVQRLWTNLKNKYPNTVRSLATRRLQQDPLENCFGCIRGLCGSNFNPNATQFVAALKTAIINNLNRMSAKTNCEDDNVALLNNLHIFLNKKVLVPETSNKSDPDATQYLHSVDALEECDEDILMSEMQACAYVCGFIVKKILRNMNCEKCNSELLSENITPYHMFITFKEYSDRENKLIYPSEKLTECIEELAKVTNTFLKDKGHESDIKNKICNLLKSNKKTDLTESCNIHHIKIKESIAQSVFYILLCVKRFCIISNQKLSREIIKEQLKNKIQILKHE